MDLEKSDKYMNQLDEWEKKISYNAIVVLFTKDYI
jgi:hypothetical protein